MLASQRQAGRCTVTVENVSANRGSISTPIAPVFYATHVLTWSLFKEGDPAGSAGLEGLAEDGSPAELVASYTGSVRIGMVGAQNTPVGGVPGPAAPGQSYQFTVTPDATNRFLTIAAMVVQTNDVFLAFGSEGVALLEASGTPRPAADVNADIRRMLAVWDAGTEANEVPGVGLNQAPRQAGPNIGASDTITTVRRYTDWTNDLAGTGLGGFVEVSIVAADQTPATVSAKAFQPRRRQVHFFPAAGSLAHHPVHDRDPFPAADAGPATANCGVRGRADARSTLDSQPLRIHPL